MTYCEYRRMVCLYTGLKKRYAREDCDLSCFVPREGQEEAFGLVQKFADDYIEGTEPQGLLLIGGVGSGKTYIVASLLNYLVDELQLYKWDESESYSEISVNHKQLDFQWTHGNEEICFIVLSELYEFLKYCYGRNDHWSQRKLIQHLQQVQLLVLDDVGAEKTSEWTKEILFNIIDYRYGEQLPMIVTTNCVPEELKEKIGDRNFDRLRESCALVSLVSESQRKTASLPKRKIAFADYMN